MYKGSEAVSWMEDKLLLTRLEAVQIGDWIMSRGYFRHVSDSRGFFDDHFCYTTAQSFKSHQGAPESLVFKRKLIDVMHNNKSIAHKIYLRSTGVIGDEGYAEIGFNNSLTKVHIPPLLKFCVEQLNKEENCGTEGIFRLSAQVAIVERLQMLIGCCIDGGITVLSAVRGEKLAILFAQILKVFLSDLEGGVFPQKEQEIWLNWKNLEHAAVPTVVQPNYSPSRRTSICGVLKLEEEDNICSQCSNTLILPLKSIEDPQVDRIRKILFQLPSCSITLIWQICTLLSKISQNPSTMMDVQGLTKLFTPILFRIESSNVQEFLKHTATMNEILEFIITNQREIFSVPTRKSPMIGKNRSNSAMRRRSLVMPPSSGTKRSSSIQFQ